MNKIVLLTLGCLIVFLTLIPLIRKDYWTFRVFEYPRVQKFVLTVFILALFVFGIEDKSLAAYGFIVLLVLNACYLLYLIYPFTPFARKTVKTLFKTEKEQTMSLVISNVYQDNQNARSCLNLFRRIDPDVILLVETNKRWLDQLKELESIYPFRLLFPLENTYGMALYSKLELRNEQIRFLVEDDVPSVYAEVVLRSGQQIRLYGLHPTPPVPNENPRSTERDKEILLVGKEVKKSQLPVIVAGDLNDVAWSYTTDLFVKISGLLDPRVGRGFFNTFHARYPLLRFPLDHVFCSNDFFLVDLKRLSNCGSDHFPMYVKLQYDPAAKLAQEKSEADADEKETAEEKVNKPV